MSLLNLDFDDVYEPVILPQGTEVQLRITEAEDHISDAGNPSTHIVFEDPSNDKVDGIHLYLSIPTEDTKPQAANVMLRWYQKFYKSFGIENVPDLDSATFVGLTGHCVVGEEDSPQYGRKNTIKDFI